MADAGAPPPPPPVDPSAGISDAALSARLHAVLQAADIEASSHAIRKVASKLQQGRSVGQWEFF